MSYQIIKNSISIQSLNDSIFVPVQHYQTSYSVELIELILNMKGAYLCDEIMREEDPSYVQNELHDAIFMYIQAPDFENKRVLDFGCGAGASTVILARMFPSAQIVGVDLVSDFLSITKARARYYGFDNIEFRLSPNGKELPKDIEYFDYVILNAVYEHLLPDEREPVLRQIWSIMKPGGILFMTQTPNRFFPIEKHTTGIPFLNYLPDRVVLAMAHRLSKQVSPDESWETLLRRGIRGATEREIMNILRDNYHDSPALLKPGESDLCDSIDIL
jgi:2-polyprenyl-3-methyl-5-hydroxy-6-metoxy-1,4-benzoquinol methylase